MSRRVGSRPLTRATTRPSEPFVPTRRAPKTACVRIAGPTAVVERRSGLRRDSRFHVKQGADADAEDWPDAAWGPCARCRRRSGQGIAPTVENPLGQKSVREAQHLPLGTAPSPTPSAGLRSIARAAALRASGLATLSRPSSREPTEVPGVSSPRLLARDARSTPLPCAAMSTRYHALRAPSVERPQRPTSVFSCA